MAQKKLVEIPVLRDFAGHRFAGERGYNLWTCFWGTVVEKIKDK